MTARFGPAGNPEDFYNAGFKASADMPAWLAEQGLGAYEYSCTRGVTIREETARLIGGKAAAHDIKVSMHAPYYISLATEDENTAANTVKHFLKALDAAVWMGVDRIVFHMGGIGKLDRTAAMERATRRFANVLEEAAKRGLTETKLLPETHGKRNQLGTVEEVLALCRLSPQVIPAIDFGHLHGVSGGGFRSRDEFLAVFDRVAEVLSPEVAKNLHIHFSKLEFTPAGEKRHWTFADPFGPPFEPLMEVVAANGFTPRIICESAGTQARDARTMQEYYHSLLTNDKK